MSLKVELKPGERIIVGDCTLTNCGQRTRILIDGATPILREKDIMTPAQADTPARRIYLAVQLMYTSRDPRAHHDTYFELVREMVQAAPSTRTFVDVINNQILMGDVYKALKEAQKLIAYEKDLFEHAKRGPGLQQRFQADRESA